MTASTAKQLKCSAQCVVRYLLRSNFKSSELLTVEQVPPIHRELYIYTGYRPAYRSWKYYIHSILHLHNETINIWTHLIGFFFILFHLLYRLQDYDVINDQTTWPVINYGLCALLSMVLSTAAHLLHSKSPWHHYVLFMLDYAAVAVYGYGVGVGSMYITSHAWFRTTFHWYFIPANILVSVSVFFAFCKARMNSFEIDSQRKRLMILSVVGQGLFLLSPLALRYTDCFAAPDCSLHSLNHLSLVLVMDILCAFTFVALIPERFVPGKCDIFGHSHQIFHTVAVATAMSKITAMGWDMENVAQKSASALLPSHSVSYLVLSFVVLIGLHTMVYFYFLGCVKTTLRSSKMKNKKS